MRSCSLEKLKLLLEHGWGRLLKLQTIIKTAACTACWSPLEIVKALLEAANNAGVLAELLTLRGYD